MRVVILLLDLAALSVVSAGRAEIDTREQSEDCVCVPYYQCANGSIIQDGASLIDVRLKDEETTTGCDNYLDVCCNSPPVEKGPKLEPQPGVVGTVAAAGKGSCGVRHPNGVGFRQTRDMNNAAQFGEFPWMSAVLLSAESMEQEVDRSTDTLKIKYVLLYLCGGSLIHPRVVLTGAHCVASHTNATLTVRFGEWDSQTSREMFRHQDREVTEIVIHPDFKKDTLYNDVALLFLSQPVDSAKHIGFACLPSQGRLPPPATRCFASGWGKDAFGREGKYNAILKKVELPVVGHGKCQVYLRRTRLGHYFKLHHSFMCAGGEKGIDTCKGDGGSPLVCPHTKNREHYMQSGIVAWGIGCLDQETPGVYVNVAVFRDWIDEKMNEHHLETSYYSL